MASEGIILEVMRYCPDTDSEPRFQQYEAPYRTDWVVLDALNWIKDQIDGTLSFRWSCRMGVCGSCGMMIDGAPKLSCAAFLCDYYPKVVRVEPLAHFPVARDLIIVLDDFMGKLTSIKPWIIRSEGEEKSLGGEYLQTPAQLARFKQYSMCINCMLCYAACPVYGQDSEYLGPAAIALAQRYNLDSRDQGREERQDVLARHDGAWMCEAVGECTVVCPKKVDPSGAIQRAKLASALDWYKSWFMPSGKR